MKELENLFKKNEAELLVIFNDRMNTSFKQKVESRFIRFSAVDHEVGQYHESFGEFIDQLRALSQNDDERFSRFLDDLHDVLKDDYNTDEVDEVLPSFNYTL